MVRPNMDIPNSLHGRVKDIQDNTDLSLDEAYYEAIIRGVSDLEDVLLDDDEIPQRRKQQIRELGGKP